MRLFHTRKVDDFVGCYLRSVGNNATLLVNVGPNTKGELPQKYIKRMVAAKEKLQQMFKEKIEAKIEKVSDFEYQVT